MTPYIIHCPTCRASLRVKKPEAIDQIVRCPKCAGMVKVQPPPAASKLSYSDSSARQASTPESVSWSQIDELLAAPRRPAASSIADADSKRQKRWKGAPPSNEDAMECGRPYSESEMAVPRRNLWVPTRVRRRKRRAIMTTLGALAIGSVICIGWLSYKGDAAKLATPSVRPTPSNEALPLPAAIGELPVAKVAKVANEGPSATGQVTLTSHQREIDNQDNQSTAPSPVTRVDHQTAIATPSSALADSPSPSRPTPGVNVERKSGSRKAVDHFGNLFGEPEQENQNDANTPVPSQSRPSNGTRPTSVAPQQRDQSLRTLQLPTSLRSQFEPITLSIQNDSLPRKPVDVKTRLKDPVEELSLNLGLGDLLTFVSQMSTIPFTVHPESLRYSQIHPDVLIPINANRTTIQRLLNDGLAPHQLAIRSTKDGHAVVERKANVSGEFSTNKHEVGDLMDAGVQAPELTSLVRQLVDPFSWTEIDSPARIQVQKRSLVLRQREAAHFETMFLLEHLRVARGMSLQGRMERNEFSNDWERTADLKQPIALRTTKGDTLESVMKKLDGLAGNEHHVMVNWQALASEAWQRSTPVNASIPRQPLATALPALLEPLKLTHRCVGPRIIEVTTYSAAAGRAEIGVHSIGSLTQAGYQPQTVIRQIETTLGEQNFRRGGGRGAIVFHDGAQSLLVRLPQSQQPAVDWVIQKLGQRL